MALRTMEGAAEVAFRDGIISADMLSEIAIVLNEGTRSRTTLAGTFTTPSGTLEESTATTTLYPPSWGWLGENIIRSRYNAPSGTQDEGNIIWNANNCSGVIDLGPLNIHFVCEDDDNKDVFFYNAQLQVNIAPTYNESDPLSVELVFHAQPDENGNVYRLGTGDLTHKSIWNPATEETEEVASS